MAPVQSREVSPLLQEVKPTGFDRVHHDVPDPIVIPQVQTMITHLGVFTVPTPKVGDHDHLQRRVANG